MGRTSLDIQADGRDFLKRPGRIDDWAGKLTIGDRGLERAIRRRIADRLSVIYFTLRSMFLR